MKQFASIIFLLLQSVTFHLYSQDGNANGQDYILRYDSAFNTATANYDSDPVTAIEFGTISHQIALENNDTIRLINSNSLLGNLKYNIADFEGATYYFLEALRLNTLREDSVMIALSLNNLGAIYNAQEEWEKSIQNFNTALEYGGDKINYGLKFDIYFNMAVAKESLGKDREAYEKYQEAMKIAESASDAERIASVLVNMGFLLNQENRPDEAILLLERGLYLCDSISNFVVKLFVLTELGNAYSLKNNYSRAIEIFTEAAELAAKQQNYMLGIDAYTGLTRIYSKTSDFKSAFQSLEMVSQLKDSVYQEEKQAAINEMLVKYDVGQKEQENNLLKEKNASNELRISRNRILMYAVSSSFLVIIFIGILFNYRSRSKQKLELLKKEKLEAELKNKMTVLELTALRAQINPHFIFNCLNSIQNCIETGNIQTADTYLDKFSKLLRMMLEFSGKQYISLSDEISYLNYYLELESLRFSNSFTFEIICDPDIDPENFEIPTLIVQPFAENAIKHGLTPMTSPGYLSIKFSLDKDFLIVKIEDNGIGRKKSMEMKSEKGQKHRSMGMEITTSRIKKLNEELPDENLLKITDLYENAHGECGTRVEIRLPL